MDSQPDPAEPGPHPLLVRAMEAHRAGRVDEAGVAYAALLAEQPDNPDGLHLSALLCVAKGRTDEALARIGRALELRPGEPMFHNNIANLYQMLGRLDEAERHYIAAIDLEPFRLDAYNNAALLQARRGDLDGAARTLQRVVTLAPEFVDARRNLASIHLRGGNLEAAIRECGRGLVTDPQQPSLRYLLGQAYHSLGRNEMAIQVYRDWLRDDPTRPEPAHYLAALTGEAVPERASDAFVRSTFDDFAGSFDAHLAELGYRAPQLVASVVRRACGEAAAPGLDVADAGCGTGLCAPLLRPHARRLVGVDLSGPMLERARERGGYDELVQGELVQFLHGRPQAFDLLVSADTLCYFGRVEEFAVAARGSVREGGLVVFTVEAHPDSAGAPDFTLHPHGRYSHRRGYLQAVLEQAGFAAFDAEAVVLRQEGGKAVHGWLVSARAARVA
jgi:predicted TPR repeat methyltransferase